VNAGQDLVESFGEEKGMEWGKKAKESEIKRKKGKERKRDEIREMESHIKFANCDSLNGRKICKKKR
jgi:hypothetical protein